MELMKLLQRLTGAFGPSGCEKQIREEIAELVAPYVDELTTDTMGNLIAHKKGKGAKMMFAAHMDSIGIIITHVEENGFLRFGSIGGLPMTDIVRQSVVFENGIRGVIGVSEDKEDAKDLKITDFFVDIGAKDRNEALSMVQLGDMAVYDAPCYEQNGRVYAKYLDNRSGCAVLIAALEQIRNAKNDLYFVFTTQEEMGLRGAKPAAFGVDPDVGIAVDVTGSDDVPGATHFCSSVLGKGPGVKVMDRSVICQPHMVAWMNRVAEQAGIAVQQDVLRGGGTDAGAMIASRMGVYSGGICIPCRYCHAPVAVCDLSDIEASARFAAALAESEFVEE